MRTTGTAHGSMLYSRPSNPGPGPIGIRRDRGARPQAAMSAGHERPPRGSCSVDCGPPSPVARACARLPLARRNFLCAVSRVCAGRRRGCPCRRVLYVMVNLRKPEIAFLSARSRRLAPCLTPSYAYGSLRSPASAAAPPGVAAAAPHRRAPAPRVARATQINAPQARHSATSRDHGFTPGSPPPDAYASRIAAPALAPPARPSVHLSRAS